MLHNGAVMSRDKPGNVSENVGDCTFCSFLFFTFQTIPGVPEAVRTSNSYSSSTSSQLGTGK